MTRTTLWAVRLSLLLAPGIAHAATTNVAQGKPATASSVQQDPWPENQPLVAAQAFDGDALTRWGSVLGSDDEWLMVDLQGAFSIDRVRLNWESAYASGYEIQLSSDGVDWSTVVSESAGDGGVDDLAFPAMTVRHVRLHATQRGTNWGYSLFEMEVFGETARSGNLALGRHVAATSVEQNPFPEPAPLDADFAVDGDVTTRWGSEIPEHAASFYIDLGAEHSIDEVVLHWEAAFAAGYSIAVPEGSLDSESLFCDFLCVVQQGRWVTVHSQSAGTGGVETVDLPRINTRYLRINLTDKGTQWGYSLYEIEVFGPATGDAPYIVRQQSPLLVPAGASYTAAITAAGPNLSYQWVDHAGTPVSGGTDASVTLTAPSSYHPFPTQDENQVFYSSEMLSCQVSNATGSTASDGVLVSVLPADGLYQLNHGIGFTDEPLQNATVTLSSNVASNGSDMWKAARGETVTITATAAPGFVVTGIIVTEGVGSFQEFGSSQGNVAEVLMDTDKRFQVNTMPVAASVPTVAFQDANPYTVDTVRPGTFGVPVVLSHPYHETVEVGYFVSADYTIGTLISGRLSIAPGDTQGVISFSTTHDDHCQPTPDQVNITLLSPTNAVIGAINTRDIVRAVNVPTTPTFELDAFSTSISEGSVDQVAVALKPEFVSAYCEAIMLRVRTVPLSADATDFVPVDKTLLFDPYTLAPFVIGTNPKNTSGYRQTIDLIATGDDEIEGSEAFELRVELLSGSANIEDPVTTFTIDD